MDISKIDKNFHVPDKIKRDGMKFYNVLQPPFKIYGLQKPESEKDCFKRIPTEIAKTVSDSVYALNTNTAGGRVRFKTNSKRIAIHAVMPSVGIMPHFAMTGSAGFDMYTEQRYAGTFVPPWAYEHGNEYDSVLNSDGETHTFTINFPLYSSVESLYIGLDENASLSESVDYAHSTPIVYYGSSITQGGCASRSGNCYQNIISRNLDTDYINLGFSGSAKAEDEIANYICNLNMSVFVYDYDHNAPTIEHLQNTHKKMFDKIRACKPNLPILILPAPIYEPNDEWARRKEIVYNTYLCAVDAGDTNVYYIDGKQLMLPYARHDGTVDGCHPNDLGFKCIAENIESVLKNIL